MAKSTDQNIDFKFLYKLSICCYEDLDFEEKITKFLNCLWQSGLWKDISYWSAGVPEKMSGQFTFTHGFPKGFHEKHSIVENHPVFEKLSANLNPEKFHLAEGIFKESPKNDSLRKSKSIVFPFSNNGIFLLGIPDNGNQVDNELLDFMLPVFINLQKQFKGHVQDNNTRIFDLEKTSIHLINNSLDAIVTIDEEGYILDWNDRSVEIFGYSREEVIGKEMSDFIIPKGYRDSHKDGMKRFLATGEGPVLNQRIEITAIGKHRDEFPVELTVTPIAKQDGYIFTSFIRDISTRKLIESELQNLKNFYEQVLNSLPSQVAVFDESARYLFVSKTGISNSKTREWILGHTNEEYCIEKGIDPKIGKLRDQNIKKVIETGIPISFEEEFHNSENLSKYYIRFIDPIRNMNGKVIQAMGWGVDITERKEAEKRILKAKEVAEQAQLAERQFLMKMSHEIRTPMNAVIGMTHLLFESGPDQTQKRYLEALKFSADSLMNIISNILDHSKIEAGELVIEHQPFSLNELVYALKNSFEFRLKEKNVDLLFENNAKLTHQLTGDKNRLNQILTNLLENACKFTDSGQIGLNINPITTSDEAITINFNVWDTGIGINKKNLNLIFDGFKQLDHARFGGTGLGLAIVKELVEMQGGSLEVTSVPGEGSSFSFTLAYRNSGIPVSVNPQKKFKTALTKDFQNANILVVEDNAMNKKLVEEIFSSWECNYDISSNGIDALKKVNSKVYDLILMDLSMPEMDGFAAAEAIRSMADNPNQNVPIIALTAAALQNIKTKAYKAGMNDFISKPCSPKQLKKVMKKWINPSVNTMGSDTNKIEQEIKFSFNQLLNFGENNTGFVKEMVDIFVKNTPEDLIILENSLANNEWEKVALTAHKLKSNLKLFSLKLQAEYTQELEDIAKSENPDSKNALSLFKKIQNDCHSVIPEIEKQGSLL